MRHLLCAACGEGMVPGKRLLLPESAIGEPAEYERIQRGKATTPTSDVRKIIVNHLEIPLSLDAFDCDLCNAQIKPGDEAVARTVWIGIEPAAWEGQYLVAMIGWQPETT